MGFCFILCALKRFRFCFFLPNILSDIEPNNSMIGRLDEDTNPSFNISILVETKMM